MYQNPIEMVVKNVSEQVTEDFNNQLKQSIMYTVNKEYHINVDEKELIRALQYDRQQYNQGYDDGRARALGDMREYVEYAVKLATDKFNEYTDFHCKVLADDIIKEIFKQMDDRMGI